MKAGPNHTSFKVRISLSNNMPSQIHFNSAVTKYSADRFIREYLVSILSLFYCTFKIICININNSAINWYAMISDAYMHALCTLHY